MKGRRVYLDWNATTPPLESVRDAMRDAPWGNPSSIHADGRRARSTIEDAREELGRLTGTEGRDVVLTSGGTEANNLALRSLGGKGLVTSRLEHPSVVRVAETLETRWARVLPSGEIDVEDVDAKLEPGMLVSVMAVNHETGVVQPIAEIVRRAHAKGALVHVDATQAWGKVEVPRGADAMTIAGHKMRGPKGIGALAMRAGLKLFPVLLGGAQERGVRPGTGDAALAAGLGVAAARAQTAASGFAAHVAPLRDRLESELVKLGGARVGTAARAPHVMQCSFAGWAGAELVAALDLEGVSVSSGSACSAGTVEPSPVLVAMGHPAPASAVRVSLGDDTSDDDVTFAIEAFRRILDRGPVGS